MENNATIKIKLLKCLQIIREYDWLIDAYILDFYVENHWLKLPQSWRQHLETLQPEHLSKLLHASTDDSQIGEVWPLAVLALKSLLRDLCISRKSKQNVFLPRSTIVEHPKLKHIFTRCVKPKKRHEIEKMASICKQSCMENPVDFVVDFGAGLGHLARILGYGFGIRVCCLEMQKDLNEQARLIDLQLEGTASKYLSHMEMSAFQRPTHVTLCLTANMEAEKFLIAIKESLCISDDNNNNFTFGIIGLHPCGDLGAILMRMFLQCSQAKFLNFVGCCYMKLSTNNVNSKTTTYGYPLSKYLTEEIKLHSHLSYEAREIACHASEMYYDRLSTGNYEHLKVHSFRAAAERILMKHWPELKHCGLKSVKHLPGMTFEDYFYKAVQGLPAAILPSNALQSQQTTSDLENWKRIVIFYTLRLMCAPLVESVILYDRVLFLQENNCQVEVNAIFDPCLSPRNHITSAFKLS